MRGVDQPSLSDCLLSALLHTCCSLDPLPAAATSARVTTSDMPLSTRGNFCASSDLQRKCPGPRRHVVANSGSRAPVCTSFSCALALQAVMLIANVCIALVIVFLACKMAYPALVEYHYGSLVVSRSTLQKYRLLHVVARVNLLSLKCRTAKHDGQMNSPMMYAASTKVYDSPRASCLHHKCINCCIHLAPSALQCRTLRAHVHLEVLLHRSGWLLHKSV